MHHRNRFKTFREEWQQAIKQRLPYNFDSRKCCCVKVCKSGVLSIAVCLPTIESNAVWIGPITTSLGNFDSGCVPLSWRNLNPLMAHDFMHKRTWAYFRTTLLCQPSTSKEFWIFGGSHKCGQFGTERQCGLVNASHCSGNDAMCQETLWQKKQGVSAWQSSCSHNLTLSRKNLPQRGSGSFCLATLDRCPGQLPYDPTSTLLTLCRTPWRHVTKEWASNVPGWTSKCFTTGTSCSDTETHLQAYLPCVHTQNCYRPERRVVCLLLTSGLQTTSFRSTANLSTTLTRRKGNMYWLWKYSFCRKKVYVIEVW